MSALAARRAAALLASQNASPSSSSASAPEKPRTPSPSPSPSPEIQESDSEGESSTSSPSPPPLPPSSKKRKLRKSSPPPDIAPRYDSTPQPKPTSGISQSARSTRQRRFSPSAPAELPDSVSEDDSDSSVGDSDAGLAEEGMNDVDEGRAQWSLPVTSVESTPGPSRARPRPSMQDHTSNTSNFTPIEGVNIHKLTENALKSAGLQDDCSGDGTIISLAKEETLIVAGSYTLTALSGSISISSCTLSPDGSSHPIFAPTSHPIPVISPSTSTATQKTVSWLNKLKLPKGFKKGETLFLVRENTCGIDGLRYGAIPGFAHIWLEEVGTWGLKGVHPVIGSFPTPIYPHVTPATWSKALTSLPSAEGATEQPFVGLVKGPKRSGKSTFSRAVLNKLLERYERAAWLECDLGQGEFSAGGIVGLWVLDKQVLGPSFTHPLIPYRAHYLGTYTPLTCPDEYIAALKHLLEVYKFDIQHSFSSSSSSSSKINDQVPLVINTQGWVKGLGEDLLRSTEGMSEPTHIYSFTSPYQKEENSYINGNGNGWTTSPPYQTSFLPDPYDGQSNTVKRITLDPAPITPLQARFSAADLRVLSILSYFYASLPTEGSRVRWDFTKPLTYLNPWEIEYGSSEDKAINKIYMIGEGSEGIIPEDLGLALNGAVVALIEFLRPTFDGEEEEVYIQGREPPSLDDMNFLGLGLVRYIEPSSSGTEGKIHLLTPLAPDVLGRCKGLIKNGAIELPSPGLLDWLNPPRGEGDGEIPFFDKSGVEVVGGERRRWRKNIMRKGM